ncbi:solute carrier family 2, facilitated glucose transporter member 8 [Lingula anatina]|uniref:Solute carrier family 2, facilitated glucose transporter member 8 n=1 Tax=Lingula anatina TaxID=7574 RepID=A0A1S3IJD9_LINAN|nr:solute carrier family 2, facilitated glucose transporter member 8 [Lingula anatina]|eukprot:XP_013398228.1 solute carrier family 2, facilitated glucose transporter member 8 [Lingula anatina]
MATLLNSGGKLVNSKYNGTVKNLIVASVAACLGAVAFGFSIGYSSPAVSQMQKEGMMDKYQAAWFGSLLSIGGICGGPVAGWTIEKFGRRNTLMLTAVPFTLGWLLIVWPGQLLLLYVGRLLTGFGGAMITVVGPVYVAEVSTKELRGMLGSGIQLGITLGILDVYTLGMFFKWTNLALISIIPGAACAILMYFMPESPRYLLANNRKSEAMASLQFLRGPHTDVQEECSDIEEGLESQDQKLSFEELWTNASIYRPLKVGIGLMVFQQMSGINVFMFFSVSIFENAGFKEMSEYASVVIGGVQVVFTVLACIIIDRAGRRPLLIFAGAGMSISCLTFGWYFHAVAGGTPAASLSWLALGSLIVYIIAFSLGWGPVPMLVVSEIFPTKAKGTATGIAVFVNWFFGFVCTKYFANLQDMLGDAGSFWFFGVFCVAGFLFSWKYVPETRGKSLEDIELYFVGSKFIPARGV